MTTKTNSKIQELTKKAKALLSAQPLETIIESFEMTSEIEITAEVALSREWLMDELDARDPEAFEIWLDSTDDSPRKYYMMEA